MRWTPQPPVPASWERNDRFGEAFRTSENLDASPTRVYLPLQVQPLLLQELERSPHPGYQGGPFHRLRHEVEKSLLEGARFLVTIRVAGHEQDRYVPCLRQTFQR